MSLKKRRRKKQKNKLSIFKKIGISLGVITFFIFLVIFSMVADAIKLVPKLQNPNEIKLDQTTKIYAANKKLLTNVHAEQNRIWVKLDKIPTHLRQAIIATEDKRFYRHRGIDPEAIARAFVENFRSGKIVEGGSTLTQQYIKNVFTSQERTLNRKLKEAILAYELEKRVSKNNILEKYLNTVYFGHGNYGVETAAESYFGKKVEKLTLGESAMLAGVIRSPQRYSPWTHKDIAISRRNLVLSRMAKQENLDKNGNKISFISKKELERAKDETPDIKPPKPEKRYPGAYFIDYIRHTMLSDKRFGETEQDRANAYYRGGLRIYTTFSYKAQKIADEAINSTLDRSEDPYASLVAIEPKTGYVKAISGGRDFFSTKDKYAKFNLAVQAKRQTGSAFKVFVLAAAIKDGLTPYKTYDSSPATLKTPGGGTWKVSNYDGKGYGRMSIREATIRSVNAAYARIILDIGTSKVVSIAHKMGIKSKIENYPAIALGGLRKGVNTFEMASAMTTLANNGEYIKPIAIRKITDSRGKILLNSKAKPKRVMAPSVASTITTILQDVIRRGTGKGANIGRAAAGKTGTAQNYQDAWFIGYTPDLAAAVWVGHPRGQVPMLSVHGRRVSGGSFPATIWGKFMREALIDTPRNKFPYSKWQTRESVVELCNGTEDMQACESCPDGTTYTKTFYRNNLQLRPCNMHDCVSEDEAKVPKVIGLSTSSAVRKLNAAGFNVSKESQESSRKEGTVLGQSPGAGAKAKKGQTVTISISTGSVSATVPSVVGSTEADAVSAITNAGLTASVSHQAGPPEQAGKVISQNPASGSSVDKNSTVSIVVGQ